MPKFLAGKVVVTTFEVFAVDEVTAREYILKWQEGESEEPEPGIKVTSYRLGWEEFNTIDPTPERNKVLAAFLNLMQQIIPGMPVIETPPEKSKIIRPFDRINNPPPSPRGP